MRLLLVKKIEINTEYILVQRRFNSSGFTLIEVLISVFILGVGILGVFSMQSRALMDNQDAYIRTQAVFLAYDLSDRIRTNSDYWQQQVANNTVATAVSNAAYAFCNAYDPATDTVAEPPAQPSECTAQELAAYDIYRWKKDVDDVLPNAQVTISQEVDANTTTTDQDIIQIKVKWNRVNQDTEAKLGQLASYTLDVRP